MKDEEKSVVAAGPRNDAQNTYKAGQLPPYDSPLWDDAPQIIKRHFAGMDDE